jgi:AAA+ ATPase superfamily predicted ATPase
LAYLEGADMLVDRERELGELDALLEAPTARLVAVSGRRRLGKNTLLIYWAKTSQHPYLYWLEMLDHDLAASP